MVTSTTPNSANHPAAAAALATPKKPAKYNDDIIDDVLRRVIEMAPAFSAALAAQIARDVRHEWAGDRTRLFYVARREDELRSSRNDAIRRDYLAGERLALLERRYDLTQRRILQIIKQK
jgi:Mor family transcriptional regulator